MAGQVGGPNVTVTSGPAKISNNDDPTFGLSYGVSSGNTAQARLLTASDSAPGPYQACNGLV